jgi:glycosyltransferase involved in cell wall biosynthesis
MPTHADEILASTAVVVPAYFAEAHLAGVLKDVQKVVPSDRIIVVDDGSTDTTGAIAAGAGVVVERHPVNRGKGAAIVTGGKRALEMGLQYVVTLDADGQHNPQEIPKFAHCAAETGAAIVVGNRMDDRGDMPFIRVFANKVTSAFVSLRAGQRVPDSQNGYRLVEAALFGTITFETTRYDTESEILIKASRLGKRIASVSVETIYGEEISKVNPFVDTLRFFRLVFRSLFW